MTDYELLIAVSESTSEEEQKKILSDIEETIGKLGGKVAKVDNWGKKALAFSIGKNKNGFYSLLNFSGEAQLPKALADKLRINEQILRYLITKKEELESKVKVKVKVKAQV